MSLPLFIWQTAQNVAPDIQEETNPYTYPPITGEAPDILPTELTWGAQQAWGLKSGLVDEESEGGVLLNATTESDFAAVSIRNNSGATLSKNYANGGLTISKTGTGLPFINFPGIRPKAAFWCIDVTISGWTSVGGSYTDLIVGTLRDTNVLHGVFSIFPLKAAAYGGNYLFDNGAPTFDQSGANAPIPATGDIRVVMVGTGLYVTTKVFVDGGAEVFTSETSSNSSRLTVNGTQINSKTILNNCNFAIGLSGDDTSSSIKIKSVKAGYFMGIGFADQHPIMNEKGVRLIVNNKAYFTASRKGIPTGNTADFATMGVYTLDLTTYEVRSMGNVFRDFGDKVTGDFSSQIIHHTDHRNLCFCCNWSDVSGYANLYDQTLAIYHAETTVDILKGHHIVSGFQEVPLDENEAITDCSFTQRNDGWWYAGGSVNPQYGTYNFRMWKAPAISGPWQMVADDTSGNTAEGTKVAVIGRVQYMAGGKTGGGFKVWDLDGNYIGLMTSPSSEFQPAHLCYFPKVVNGQTTYVFLVMQTTSGYWPQRATTNGEYYVHLSQTITGIEQ